MEQQNGSLVVLDHRKGFRGRMSRMCPWGYDFEQLGFVRCELDEFHEGWHLKTLGWPYVGTEGYIKWDHLSHKTILVGVL